MNSSPFDFVKIYRMLEDDESKDIFLKRLNYFVSGDFKYIREIISAYRPEFMPAMDAYISDLIMKLPKDRNFVLYGAGQDVAKWLEFKVDGKRPFVDDKRFAGLCSKTKSKQKNGYLGYPVIRPEELLARKDLSVIIFSTNARLELLEELKKGGYPQDLILDGPAFYNQGLDDPEAYFSPNFITYEDQEIFIDAGSYDLDTSLRLQKYCKHLKVYAFEPDPENYQRCLARKELEHFDQAVIFPYGTWSECKELYFDALGNTASSVGEKGKKICTVSAVPIDEMVEKGDKITFIKMDVEGAELESLKGARETIQRDHPKLAICIYHKPEDLWTIPLYIKELVPEYKLYLRHHTNGQSDTVLYAIIS